MYPAYYDGVVVFFRLEQDIQADMIDLIHKEARTDDIKRVVAVPGQTVDINEGNLLIDGVSCDEPYIAQETDPSSGKTFPLVLGENEYFCIGDQREYSIDSSSVDTVSGDRIGGQVIFIW